MRKNPQCYERKCKDCLHKIGAFISDLNKDLDGSDIEEIQYSKWTATDRSTLQLVIQNVNEFTQSLEQQLKDLLWHDFITKKQYEYTVYLKELFRKANFSSN